MQEWKNLPYRVLWYADNPIIRSALQRRTESMERRFRELITLGDPGGIFSKLLTVPNFQKFFEIPDITAIVSKSRTLELAKEDWKYLCRSVLAFLNGENMESSDQILLDPGGVIVSPVDGNPFSRFDAHPDNQKDGIGIGWGESRTDEWQKIYSETFRILQVSDPGFFHEIQQFLRKIVPLGTDLHAHRSSSYAESFGCVYLGLTLNEKFPEHSVLEGLIHEWSHNKANLLSSVFGPFAKNDRSEIYYSAYRPDPRPIIGIFLGVHALTPTVQVFLNAFDVGSIEPQIRLEKTVLLHYKNHSALSVLSRYLIPTNLGGDLLSEIRQVHLENEDRIRSYCSKFPTLAASAETISRKHFQTTLNHSPDIRY